MASVVNNIGMRMDKSPALKRAGQIFKAAVPVVTTTASASSYYFLTNAPTIEALAFYGVVGLAIGGTVSLVSHLAFKASALGRGIGSPVVNGIKKRTAEAEDAGGRYERVNQILEDNEKNHKKVIVEVKNKAFQLLEVLPGLLDETLSPENIKKISTKIQQIFSEPIFIRRLGRGGMGSVSLYYHLMLHKYIAIKKIDKDLAGNINVVSRFQEEAAALASTDHPNIVKIYEAKIGDEGPQITMEYIIGEMLSDYIERKGGRLPIKSTLQITKQLFLALEHLHGKGLVHRDIKDENVLVQPLMGWNEEERLKLVDFGISKEIGISTDKTEAKTLLGTFVFMSPEQLDGISEKIDYRSDFYSAGLMMYKMLCGRFAFPIEGNTDGESEASGRVRTEYAHKVFNFLPPPLNDPKFEDTYVPGLPAQVNDLVMRLLSIDPADRPQEHAEIFEVIDLIINSAGN